MRNSAVHQARQLLLTIQSGVLATHSKALPGYPFGSVTPFVLDRDGSLLLFISDIAQHSRNLTMDPKCSITVFEQTVETDQNTQGRVTVLGDAQKLAEGEDEAAFARYASQFPESLGYRQAHDFAVWRLLPKRIRFIGGFGKIFWLELGEWQGATGDWDQEAEAGMIGHMHRDHLDAISAMGQHFFGKDGGGELLAIHPEGCLLRLSGEERARLLAFAEPAMDAMAVRKALVALTQQSRSAIEA
ncbi:HugZ family protein [Gallaecimonas pentaromativorans]|uniref:Uncharacterized protein n=1 Tax=Gallaecimonas pentaromativorans TaxID=584787 RepID=A0A3N1P486_9GAMM|nr:pyridoxamine 5'-phosphate oxidase family protein [Gallaecimonas pentaromativorans]ROQ22438.1 hypothetical protein EDC28_11081 [Gallaecimonas pentaromativorans]